MIPETELWVLGLNATSKLHFVTPRTGANHGLVINPDVLEVKLNK